MLAKVGDGGLARETTGALMLTIDELPHDQGGSMASQDAALRKIVLARDARFKGLARLDEAR